MRIPLPGGDVIQPVKGEIPGNSGEKMLQDFGKFRRDGIPGGQIGICHDLLRILTAAQDIECDLV